MKSFIVCAHTCMFYLTVYIFCFVLSINISCGACSFKLEFQRETKAMSAGDINLRLLCMKVGGDRRKLK